MAILDFLNIPDFLGNYIPDPFQKIVVYTVLFCVIGLVIAWLTKSKLLILKPNSMFNMIPVLAIIFVITRMKGIFEVGMIFIIVGFLITEMLAFKLFKIPMTNIMVLECEKTNIILDEYVTYMKNGKLAVALQDNRSHFYRLFLGRHVFVEANSSTSWTLDYKEQLFICNSYRIIDRPLEMQENPEDKLTDRVKGIFKQKSEIVMEIDVTEAHEYNRFAFIRKVGVLDYLVLVHEKLEMKYTKLRTLFTALLAKKHKSIILSALKIFEDAITITPEDRQIIMKIGKKEDKEEKQDKKKVPEEKKVIKENVKVND